MIFIGRSAAVGKFHAVQSKHHGKTWQPILLHRIPAHARIFLRIKFATTHNHIFEVVVWRICQTQGHFPRVSVSTHVRWSMSSTKAVNLTI